MGGRIKMFFHFALVGEERREEMLTKMPKNGRAGMRAGAGVGDISGGGRRGWGWAHLALEGSRPLPGLGRDRD